MAELIQVRQAARAFGVPENTIRRWEERGLLRAVRLPSGVRRFRAEDIEAVREGMFSGFAPAARGRRRRARHARALDRLTPRPRPS